MNKQFSWNINVYYPITYSINIPNTITIIDHEKQLEKIEKQIGSMKNFVDAEHILSKFTTSNK